MHSKILAVVVLAALAAIGLGYVLLKKDAQPAPAPDKVAGRPVSAQGTLLPPKQKVANELIAVTPPVSVIKPQPEGTAARVDPVPVKPSAQTKIKYQAPEPAGGVDMRGFETQIVSEKINRLTAYLQLNAEQQVMAAAYFEELEKFNNEERRDVGRMIPNSLNGVMGRSIIQPSLDSRIAEYEIKAQELKQVRGLRDKFLQSLSAEQKNKASLYIGSGVI